MSLDTFFCVSSVHYANFPNLAFHVTILISIECRGSYKATYASSLHIVV